MCPRRARSLALYLVNTAFAVSLLATSPAPAATRQNMNGPRTGLGLSPSGVNPPRVNLPVNPRTLSVVARSVVSVIVNVQATAGPAFNGLVTSVS
jgi:hypothetical protein